MESVDCSSLSRFFILITLICSTITSYCQVAKRIEGLSIALVIPMVVNENKDLKAAVILTNKSRSDRAVYAKMSIGGDMNPLVNMEVNFMLQIEKRVDDKYSFYDMSSRVEYVDRGDSVDDLTQKVLVPGDALTDTCHLDDNYNYDPGYYRVRGIYRNNIFSSQTIRSPLVYFRVAQKINLKHYPVQ